MEWRQEGTKVGEQTGAASLSWFGPRAKCPIFHVHIGFGNLVWCCLLVQDIKGFRVMARIERNIRSMSS